MALLTGCTLAESSAEAPAGLWALTHDGLTNRLYRIDPTSLQLESRQPFEYDGVLWELAGAPTGGFAFAIDRERDLLVTIDLATATATATTPLGGDMLANGRGFATLDGDLYGNFAGTLERIDPATGALSAPVPLERGATAEALEPCGGRMFMTSRETSSPRGENLYEVEVATGRSAFIGVIETSIDIDTLACAANGQLYGVDTDPELGRTLFQIDPGTGAGIRLVDLAVLGDINGLHVTAD
jgi:hypothetical protein